MSTTAKGNAFERRVYNALAQELHDEQLCVPPMSARIFRKKAYYSRDRSGNILTDVSIEVYLPHRNRPSFIWVFECKDYKGSVPVDDIEEFHAKIQQIGEDNTKATIVTSGGLQRGALAYARSKGIGVIRLLPDDQIIHVIEFITTTSAALPGEVDWSEFETGLMNPNHRSRREFFAAKDGYWFASWYSVLAHELLRS